MNVKRFFPVVLICLCLSLGCRDRRQVDLSDIRPRETDSDHLQQALQIIDGLDTAEFGQATTTSVFNFNLWIKLHADDPDWVTPSLINTLPAEVASTGLVQSIGMKNFIPLDINYLHETSLLHAISQWVVADDQPHRLFWENYKPDLANATEDKKLSAVFKLFDWTVRNIQLDALLDYPVLPEEAGQTAKTPPQLALPGPGYHRTNRDVLTFGKGDWWQRSRIFSLLARQQGVDVVLLGLPAEFGETNIPWLTAVMVGRELYLFDFNKGLPVLNREKTKIATFKQVRSDPEFGQTLLPVSHQQDPEQTLTQLVGLIEADVVAISHRMAILEKYLTADRQMVLTVAPNVISRTLRTEHAIQRSVIWVPIYEGYLFEAALRDKVVNQDEAALEFLKTYRDYSTYRQSPQLQEGRFKLFRGTFDDLPAQQITGQERGAKTLMMASRLPRKDIESLLTNEQMQQALGLVKPKGTPAILWRQSLLARQRGFVNAKDHASFYIAMIHMEEGNYQDAIDWFEQRTLQDDSNESTGDKDKPVSPGVPPVPAASNPLAPNQPLSPGKPTVDLQDILSGSSLTATENTKLTKSAFQDLAIYNLARCYLATGENERAFQLLANSQSQQQAGDQQLLQWLKVTMPAP